MTQQEIIEELARVEHDRWANWQRYVHEKSFKLYLNGKLNSVSIPLELYNRWERQISTPYNNLSEQEKESDRKEVMRYWPIIEKYFEKPEPKECKCDKTRLILSFKRNHVRFNVEIQPEEASCDRFDKIWYHLHQCPDCKKIIVK